MVWSRAFCLFCLASPLSDYLIRVSAKCDRSCVCLMGILLYHFKAQRWPIQYVESAQAFSSWALGVYKCLGRPKKSDEFDLIFITLLMCDHNHDNNEKLVFLLFSLSWFVFLLCFGHIHHLLFSMESQNLPLSGTPQTDTQATIFNLDHFPSPFFNQPLMTLQSLLVFLWWIRLRPYHDLYAPHPTFNPFDVRQFLGRQFLFRKYHKRYVIPFDCWAIWRLG